MRTWQKGRDRQGAGRERGAERHSLAVAEDIHPVIKQNPHAQNRDQLRPVHKLGRERLLQDMLGCHQVA